MRQEKMKEAKIKAGNYCAYQERTHQEVRDKLYDLGLHGDEVEEVLTALITENFVNEERYARSFASGKFRLKHWGKKKIVYALRRKHISSNCIDLAIREIPDEEYDKVIAFLIEKKVEQLSGDEYVVRNKVARYLIGKGFEPELVWNRINELLTSGG